MKKKNEIRPDDLTKAAKPEKPVSNADDPAYHRITAQEARDMIGGEGTILVDVRRPEEHLLEHIKGSVLLPNETVIKDAAKVLPDKDAQLLVYCRSGQRSSQASHTLEKLGYRHIYDFGGILDWPYETEKQPEAPKPKTNP